MSPLSTTDQSSSSGCYGFRVTGLEAARALLVAVPKRWPELAVASAPAAGPPPEVDSVGPDHARLALAGGGWMDIRPGLVTFHVDRPRPDGDLVHPYLAPGAAIAARWAGRESFHAGALIVGDGAWAVLGGKEDGKSTLLAWLALHGHAVLADDLVVLDGESVTAGPRCVDLRAEAAARLGAGEPLGLVGARERWRLALGQVPAAVPLRGWLLLDWHDTIAVEPVRGAERLLALPPHRSVQLAPAGGRELLELSSLPIWRLRRPRRWDVFAEAVARLLGTLGR